MAAASRSFSPTCPGAGSWPRAWEAAGRPAPGDRPGEGEEVARRASGDPVVRYSSALPLRGVTGNIEALCLRAAQGAPLAERIQPAAGIVAELTSRLRDRP